MPRKKIKTRQITDAELSQRLHSCPWCKGKVASRDRFVRDQDTGLMKMGGSFFGCTNYPLCKYWVNLTGIESVHPDEQEAAA